MLKSFSRKAVNILAGVAMMKFLDEALPPLVKFGPFTWSARRQCLISFSRVCPCARWQKRRISQRNLSLPVYARRAAVLPVCHAGRSKFFYTGKCINVNIKFNIFQQQQQQFACCIPLSPAVKICFIYTACMMSDSPYSLSSITLDADCNQYVLRKY